MADTDILIIDRLLVGAIFLVFALAWVATVTESMAVVLSLPAPFAFVLIYALSRRNKDA